MKNHNLKIKEIFNKIDNDCGKLSSQGIQNMLIKEYGDQLGKYFMIRLDRLDKNNPLSQQ